MGIHTFYGQVLQQLVTPILAYLPDLPFYVPCCIIFKSLEYALLNVFSHRRTAVLKDVVYLQVKPSLYS